MAEAQGPRTNEFPDFDEFDFERSQVKDEFLIAVRVPLKFQFHVIWSLSKLERELPGVVVVPRLCIMVSGPGKHYAYAAEALRRLEQEMPDVTIQPCGVNAWTGF